MDLGAARVENGVNWLADAVGLICIGVYVLAIVFTIHRSAKARTMMEKVIDKNKINLTKGRSHFLVRGPNSPIVQAINEASAKSREPEMAGAEK